MLEQAELVTIRPKEVVYAREQPIQWAHFPEDCVISLVTELEKFSRGRKTRPPFFTELCLGLARVLTKR